MLRGLIAGILLALLLTGLTGYVIVRTGTIPANADDRPPPFERWAARVSLHATLRRSAPKTENPLPATAANVVAGIKLYAQNCAFCHGGADGKPSNVAKGLYQKPPQLARDGVEDDAAGVTYWKVAHGIRWTGMPAYDRTLSQSQIWQLALFLKTMDHLPPQAESAWRQVRAVPAFSTSKASR
jgi:thiosulfate dehydrogenase